MARWLILCLLACVAAWAQGDPSKSDPDHKGPDNAPRILIQPGDPAVVATAPSSACVIPIPGMFLLRDKAQPDDGFIKKVPPDATKLDPIDRRLPHPICKWSR